MTKALAKPCSSCILFSEGKEKPCMLGHSPRKYKEGYKRVCQDHQTEKQTKSLWQFIKGLFVKSA